jgi:putative ATPase
VGGVHPLLLVGRLLVFASEDVANADPAALSLAVATAGAVEHVGLPECHFALAQCAIYLSLAPKSDAAKRAIFDARGFVSDEGAAIPPGPLRSAAYPAARKLARGQGYQDPHRTAAHVNEQEHLPEGLEDLRFYAPDEAERGLRDRLAEIRRLRGRAGA